MMHLTYEADQLGHNGTYTSRVRIQAYGRTPDELRQDAERQYKALGCIGNMMAVGLHNTRADWEAAMGPITNTEYRFGDDD